MLSLISACAFRRNSRQFRVIALIALLLSQLSPALAVGPPAASPAQSSVAAAAAISATKTDALLIDRDHDGKADPGDTLRYTVVVSNTGSADATGVTFNDTVDSHTALAPGSIKTTPLAINQAAITAEDTPLALALQASDADGDPLTLTIITPPAHGSLSGSGLSQTYTPALDYNGADSLTYRVCDTSVPAACDTATVSLTVSPVNDPPLAATDSYTTTEDTILTAPSVLANDSDAHAGAPGENNLPLTAQLVAGPAHAASFTLAANGTFVYTPTANFFGSDSFTYRAVDMLGGASSIATVTLTITNVNDNPDAVDDNVTVLEDSAADPIDALANDTDAPDTGETLTILAVGKSANGSPVIAGGGTSLAYTPTLNFLGTDVFTYTIGDGNGGSDTATITVTVTTVNDPPTFTKGPDQVVAEDAGPQTVSPWATNISPGPPDESGQTMHFNVIGNSNSALFSAGPAISPGGDLTYTPAANLSGTATITITLQDNGGTANGGIDTSPPQSFTITVTPVNDAPTASGQSVSTNEDTPKTITLAGADVDGDNLSFAIVSGSGHGSLGSIGSPSCSGTPSSCTATVAYTPTLDFNGTDSFTFKVNDGTLDSNTATVTITVTPVNDAPTANNDSYSTNEDTALNVPASGVLGNDTDAESDPLTAILVSGPTHAASFTLNSDGSFSYTPSADYNGSDSFTYKANDGTADSAPATVSITVGAVNDAPTAGDQSVTTNEDTLKTITLTGADIDGDSLTFAIVADPSHGTLGPIGAPSCSGTPSSCTATVDYTPNANYNGPDSFSFKVNDGTVDSNTATVSITVDALNDAPVANNDSYNTGGAPTLNIATPGVLSNDTDADGNTLTAVLVANVSNGSLTLNADGSFSYTPNIGTTSDSFTYKANDGTLDSNVAMVTIAINAPPVADAQSVTTNEDTPKTITLSGTDADDDNLIFSIVSGPGHGTLGPIGSPNCAAANSCIATVVYTPTADYNGSDSFSFKVNDGQADSAAATVDITVSAVNDAPLASAQSVTTNEDTPTTITLSGSDVDGNNLTFSVVSGPTHGTLGSIGTASCSGTPSSCIATVVYTPTADYNGADSFTFRVNDGTLDSNTATVDITVSAVNDAPLASGQSVSTNEDTPTTITLSGSDVDGNNLTFLVVSGPTHGTLGSIGTASCSGTPSSCTATVVYTPTADYNGSDSFSFKVNDGTVNSAPATVSITVSAANDAPILANIEGSALSYTENDVATSVSSSITVSDVDSANLTGATIQITTNCTSGEDVLSFSTQNGISGIYSAATCLLTLSGSSSIANYQTALRAVKYSNSSENPSAATRTVTFQVNDGAAANNLSNTVTRQVTITPVNDAPILANIEGSALSYTENDVATSVSSSITTSDVDSANLTGATIQITGNCTSGEDVLSFSTQNGISSSYTAATCLMTLSGNSSVANYQTALRAVKYSNSSENPSAAPRTVRFQVNDGAAANNLSNTVTRDITVIPVNDALVLTTNPISYSTLGNTQLHVAGATRAGVVSIADAQSALAKANPTDVDGPVAPSVVAASGTSANGGSFSIAVDGSFTYVPPAGFTGTDSFTYQVTDSQTPTTGTINISVSQVVWYVRDVVDANNPSGGNGTSANAFDTLAQFNAATTNANEIIFVFAGNTATTPLAGAVTLKDGQKLWGQGIGLTVAPFGTLVAAGSQPRINNTGGDAVSVPATASNRNNVEIRGLDLQGSGNAIDVTASGANNAGVTISNNTVRGAGQEGIDVNAGSSGSVTLAINDNMLTATGNAIDLQRTVGTLTITTFDDNAISGNTGGSGIVVSGPATFDATPGGAFNTVSGGTTVIGASGAGVGGTGMVLTNVTGDLSFTDLDIFADGGAGLQAGSSGTFNAAAGTGFQIVVGAGVGVIEATGGPAVNITSATVDLQLTSLKSTNSASTGVSLDTVAGTFLAGSGSSISNATGTDFNINAGTASVTYNGTITDTTGRLVSVTNSTGGAKSFTGAISDTNSGTGQGILLTSNTGATISFSGGVVLNTGANAAFTATGGGTVNVTGANNTLTTTTGTALNVTNTTIGASGLTFKTISSNGAANGIVLNTTGGSGGLTVTGDGGNTNNGSGGTIQNTTGHAIRIANAKSVSLGYLNITNPGLSAILVAPSGWTYGNDATLIGTGVNNFTLNRSNISDNAGNNSLDDGLTLENAAGTLSITNNSINAARHQGITIDSLSGTISSLTLTGNSVTNTPGGDGVLIQMRGTSVMTSGTIGGATASLGNTFSNNSATGLQVNNADTGNIQSLNVQNNTVSGNNAGMDFDLGQSSSMTITVQNNTFNNQRSSALNMVQSTSSTAGTLTASLKSNTIGTAGVLDSGSAIGNGIRVANGAVNINLTIDSNVIREVPNGRGIDIEPQAYTVNANVKAKITNNTIARPSGTNQNIGCGANVPCPSASIFVLSDNNNVGGFDHVCTVVSGNSAYDPTSWAAGGEAAYYFARRSTTSNTLTLEGTGTPSSWILGNNTVTNSTSAPFVDEGAPTMPVVVVAAGTCGSFPLLAAGGEGHGAPSITQAALSSVATEALARWNASGLSASDQTKLAAVSFGLADLEPGHLGGESRSTVLIDRDAAGWGWYVDPTPADDAEFAAAGGDLRATKGSPAEGRMDLLTVVMHELGHVLGYDDLSVAEHPHALMAADLLTGVRRTPDQTAHVSAQTMAAPQAGSFPLNIGTLPVGKHVVITFDVTVASPLAPSITQVVNQGTVSGSNFANVLTDDPDTAALADPTITQLDNTITTFRVFLPIVSRSAAVVLIPDLVVTSISLIPNKTTFVAGEPVEVQVTVKNQSNAAAGSFWLDLYINPSSPPTVANQVWNTRCGMTPCFGMAWEVSAGLAPGQSLTLSSLSLPDGYSAWPGYFAAGTSDLYAYADSYNPGVASGAIAESDETNNRAELHGLSVTGPNPTLMSLQGVTDLRSRPIHLRK